MAWIEIRLPGGVWKYDDRAMLGKSGGFGAVFRGTGADSQSVAIKRLHLTAEDARHREMRIAEDLKDRNLSCIIPVFDSGQDATSSRYFLVMALAEQNLEEYARARGTIPESEAIEILSHIADALVEAQGLVHRDLKPDNILRHVGRWKVADFGIARFIEESTSENTLREFLTPAYAAPEQWKGERATKATDVYALGCIGYRLLSGSAPFCGPAWDDYKVQHMEHVAPNPKVASPRLTSLINQMMRKIPATRPDIQRVTKLLLLAEETPSTALVELAKADAVVGAQLAAQQAIQQQRSRIYAERKLLHAHAVEILAELASRLMDSIREGAMNVQFIKPRGPGLMAWKAHAGRGTLELQIYANVIPPADLFPKSGWDVVAAGSISVVQEASTRIGALPMYVRSASLWFTNRGVGEHRWYEVGYFRIGDRSDHEPFAVGMNDVRLADEAAGPWLGICRFASGPHVIDDEDFETFANRWIAVFAQAIAGDLHPPSHLPLIE